MVIKTSWGLISQQQVIGKSAVVNAVLYKDHCSHQGKKMNKLLINVFSALSQKVSGSNVHWWILSDLLKHILKTKVHK